MMLNIKVEEMMLKIVCISVLMRIVKIKVKEMVLKIVYSVLMKLVKIGYVSAFDEGSEDRGIGGLMGLVKIGIGVLTRVLKIVCISVLTRIVKIKVKEMVLKIVYSVLMKLVKIGYVSAFDEGSEDRGIGGLMGLVKIGIGVLTRVLKIVCISVLTRLVSRTPGHVKLD